MLLLFVWNNPFFYFNFILESKTFAQQWLSSSYKPHKFFKCNVSQLGSIVGANTTALRNEKYSMDGWCDNSKDQPRRRRQTIKLIWHNINSTRSLGGAVCGITKKKKKEQSGCSSFSLSLTLWLKIAQIYFRWRLLGFAGPTVIIKTRTSRYRLLSLNLFFF